MKFIRQFIGCLCVSLSAFASVAQQSVSIADAEQALSKACIEGGAEAIQKAALQLAATSSYGADKLEYASNLLSSVEVNGVLFTGSKGDTYPVIMLQFLKNMRTDVRVIHTEWLKDEAFFARTQAAIGMEKSGREGIRTLARKMPVYVSLAADKDILSGLSTDLYCTGLAFKCSAAPLANVKAMHNGWWQSCAKNYMTSGYSLNANYLAPIAMLADYATKEGSAEDFKILKKKYEEIAKSVGESQQLPTLK